MNPVPAVPAPQLSEPARMLGVVTSPSEAFADIARWPRWLPPLVLSLLVTVLFMWCFNQRVGWDRFISNTLAHDPRIERLPPDQRTQVLEQQRKILPIFGWVMPLIATPLGAAVIAAVLLGVFNLAMGAQFRFKNIFSIVCYASIPLAIHGLVAIAVMYLKDPDEYDLNRPTAFNLGAFLDPDTSPQWLQSLLGSFDAVVLWAILLIAIGIHALDRKRSFGSCLIGVFLPWLLYVACKTGWAAFSS